MGSAESQQFMVPASINKRGSCPNYRDPHKSVLAAFNRLMLYAGAFLAKETANEGHIDVPELMAHMDPGLEVNYTTIGYIRFVTSNSIIVFREISSMFADNLQEATTISIQRTTTISQEQRSLS